MSSLENSESLFRIGPICDRFDKQWGLKKSPDIASYFAEGLEQDREILLDELLRVEIWYRRQANENPSPSEYSKIFPGYENVIDKAFERFDKPSSSTQFDQTIEHSPSLGNWTTEPDFIPPPNKHFRIECCLGRGAYGSVWLVYDDDLKRHVAVKAPRRDREHPAAILKLFGEEAARSASLNHDSIVRIYEQGLQPDGMPYVVMQYVSGCSLKEKLGTQSLTARESIELLIPIAEGLSHAHSQGISHRDLKPANLLLSESGTPHIVDFGMAMHDRERSRRIGERVGTRSYMSPEQINRTTHLIDGRCDIWAMGVIMYEMLTGEMPFVGDDEEQLFREILERAPKPLTMVDTSLSPEWWRICSRCLAKDPANRYDNAAELARDLRRSVRPKTAGRVYALAAVLLVAVFVWPGAFGYFRGSKPTAVGKPVAAPKLDGDIGVRVWDPVNKSRRGLGLRDQGALPLKPKDQIRVEATLNQSAYVYVVWIDANGKAMPVYPWKPGDWQSFPENETPIDHINLPDQVDNGWPMSGGPGMETLLLLARDQPLPRSTNVEQLFANLPRQAMRDSQLFIEFRDGAMVDSDTGETRSLDFKAEQQIDDSVLQTQGRLQRELKRLFQLFKAVSFANAGK